MMRHFFFLALTLLGLGSLRADDSDERFFALGEECRWKDGGVRIDLYPDAVVWLNGARQATHEDDPGVDLKPGDVLLIATPIKWHESGQKTTLPPGNLYAYRLKSATAQQATFVLTSYDGGVKRTGSGGHELTLGRRRSTTIFEITLPKIIFGLDSGPNHVELGGKGSLRSK